MENQEKESGFATDSQIIELFFARSESAIERLSEKYGPSMQNLSQNILHSVPDAEECVSDACLALWNAIPPERPNPLRAYALKITRNLSLTRLRAIRAAKRDAGETLPLDEIADFVPGGDEVESAVECSELTRILNDWLSGLDRVNLYIFMRRYWYADSAETVAGRTGLSVSAVYLRTQRMKASLYKRLQKEGVLS